MRSRSHPGRSSPLCDPIDRCWRSADKCVMVCSSQVQLNTKRTVRCEGEELTAAAAPSLMNRYTAGSFCRCRDFSISSEPPRSNCNTWRRKEEGLTCLLGRKRQEMMKRTSPGRRSGSSFPPPAAGPPWTSMRQQIIAVGPTTLYVLHPEFCWFVPAASFQIDVNISGGTMSNVGEFWCSYSNGLTGACSHTF